MYKHIDSMEKMPIVTAEKKPITTPEKLFESKLLANDMPLEIWLEYYWDSPYLITVLKRALKGNL